MARPTDQTIRLATSGTRTRPTALEATGYAPGQPLPAEEINYLWGELADWVSHFKEVAAFEHAIDLSRGQPDTRGGLTGTWTYRPVSGGFVDDWQLQTGAPPDGGAMNWDVTHLLQVPEDSLQRVVTGINVQWVAGNVVDTLDLSLAEHILTRGTSAATPVVTGLGSIGPFGGVTGLQNREASFGSPVTIGRNSATQVRRFFLTLVNTLNSVNLAQIEAISLVGLTGRVE